MLRKVNMLPQRIVIPPRKLPKYTRRSTTPAVVGMCLGDDFRPARLSLAFDFRHEFLKRLDLDGLSQDASLPLAAGGEHIEEPLFVGDVKRVHVNSLVELFRASAHGARAPADAP